MPHNYRFTRHAVLQFLKRLKYINQIYPPKDVKKTLRKLIYKAEVEEIDPIMKVKRLLNNGCIEAEYLVNNGWRFVVIKAPKQYKIVLTVERVDPLQN